VLFYFVLLCSVPDSGVPYKRLSGHQDAVTSVTFSKDGVSLMSASADGSVRLWDVYHGAEYHRFTGHSGGITAVAYDRQCARFVTASSDKSILVRSVTYEEPDPARDPKDAVPPLHEGHTGSVLCTVFDDGIRSIASGGSDGFVLVWDVVTFLIVQKLRGHTGAVNAVVFARDGSRIVSGSYDKSIRIWVWPYPIFSVPSVDRNAWIQYYISFVDCSALYVYISHFCKYLLI